MSVLVQRLEPHEKDGGGVEEARDPAQDDAFPGGEHVACDVRVISRELWYHAMLEPYYALPAHVPILYPTSSTVMPATANSEYPTMS